MGKWHSSLTHCKRGHEFTPENTGKNGPNGRCCKLCKDNYSTQWRAQNRIKTRESGRRAAWKRYGIKEFSIKDYQKLFIIQNGLCSICNKYLELWAEGSGSNKSSCVDHDKATGKVRGILCRDCNRGLGLLGDTAKSLQRAANYLTEEYGGIASGCL